MKNNSFKFIFILLSLIPLLSINIAFSTWIMLREFHNENSKINYVSYSINFIDTGNTFKSMSNLTANSYINISQTRPQQRQDYTFVGWRTSNNESEAYPYAGNRKIKDVIVANGNSPFVIKSATLYAKWIASPASSQVLLNITPDISNFVDDENNSINDVNYLNGSYYKIITATNVFSLNTINPLFYFEDYVAEVIGYTYINVNNQNVELTNSDNIDVTFKSGKTLNLKAKLKLIRK